MPITGSVPFEVLFTDTTHPVGSSWLWMFGDGSTSVSQNPTHTYTTPGTYVVTLEVTGELGTLAFHDIVTVGPLFPSNGLAAYWSLDESSGNPRVLTLGSASGDLVETGGSVGSITDGRYTGGVSCTSATTPRLVATLSPAVNASAGFAFTCWFRVPTFDGTAPKNGIIISNGGNYAFVLDRYLNTAGTDILLSYMSWGAPPSGANAAATGYDSSYLGPFSTDEWHLFCGWFDATDLTWNSQIDSNDPITVTGVPPAELSNFTAINTVWITGQWREGYTNWNGDFDAVTIYNRVLTADERQELATGTTSGSWSQPDPSQSEWPGAPGVDPQIMLRLSNDGGKTWGPEMWRGIGKTGEYFKRVRWNRLGSVRRRVFEVSYTAPVPITIIGANLKANQSES